MLSFKKKVWKIISVAIRIRDSDSNGYCQCISCSYTGYYIRDKIQAGHFFQARNFKGVRWNFDNIHAQCQKCNGALQGNIYNYYIKLKDKVGQDTIDDIHKRSSDNNFKESIEYLESVKTTACQIIKYNAETKDIWDWKTLFTKQEVKEILNS